MAIFGKSAHCPFLHSIEVPDCQRRSRIVILHAAPESREHHLHPVQQNLSTFLLPSEVFCRTVPYRGIRPPAHFVPEHRRGQDNLLGKFSLPFLWRCHHQIAQRPLLGCVSETPHLVIPVYEIHTVVQIAETVFLELDTQGESGIGVGDFLHTVAERLGQGLGVIQQADEAARVDVADVPVGTPLPPVWGFHGCDAAVHSIDFHHRTAREHLPSVLFDELLQNFREMQAASYETAGSLDIEHGYDCVDISRSLVSPA